MLADWWTGPNKTNKEHLPTRRMKQGKNETRHTNNFTRGVLLMPGRMEMPMSAASLCLSDLWL